MRRVALGLLAAGAFLVSAAPAWAQTPPVPTGTVTPTVIPLPTAGPCAGLGGVVLAECQVLHHYDVVHKPVDLASEMIPGDVGTRFPLENYDLGFDAGPVSPTRHFEGTVMTTGWMVNMLFIRFGLFAVTRAFSFGFAAMLAAPAAEMSRAFTTHIIWHFGLGHIALMVLAIYCVWQVVKGRINRAGGEIATTFIIWAIAGVIMANPAGYFRGALSLVSEISGNVLMASTDNVSGAANPQPAGPFDHPEFESALMPLKRAISEALVDRPFDQLQWGESLTGQCALVRDSALAAGPWGSDDSPRAAMRGIPECAKYADFNADPSNGGRWLFAWFFAALSFLVMILLVIIALAVVGAQLLGVFLIAILSLAAAFALFPGHRAAWKWTASAGKAAGTILAASALLVVFVMFFSSALHLTQNAPPAEKMVLMSAVVVGTFWAKKHFLAAGAAMGAALASKMSGGGMGGSKAPAHRSGHVLRNLAGVSALGASAGAWRLARNFPERLEHAQDAAKKAGRKIGRGAKLVAAGVNPVAAAGMAAGEIGKAALAAGVPMQNRVSEVRDRLAQAREERMAIKPGALSEYMAGEQFAQAQRHQAQQARAAKIREGLTRVADQRAHAAALEQQAAQQAQVKEDFHSKVQRRVRDLASSKAMKDLEDLRAKRRQRPKP